MNPPIMKTPKPTRKKTNQVKKKPANPPEELKAVQCTVDGFPRTTAHLPGDVVLLKDGAAGIIAEAVRRCRHIPSGLTLQKTVPWNKKLVQEYLELTNDPAGYRLSHLPGFPAPVADAWYTAHNFYSVIKGPLHALFEKPGTLERKLRSVR